MEYYYDKKNLTTGFFKPVETNGIKLDDSYFVQINHDMLDLISKIQQETTPDDYIAKWEKKLGEKFFLYYYHNEYSLFSSPIRPVNCDRLSEYVGFRKNADMRIVDKESLTRTAARKVAEICYHGKGDFKNSSIDAAIAMILYVRNGYNKKDFWANFKKEMLLGMEELLENNGSIQIEELLLENPFEGENATIMPIMDSVNEKADSFKDDDFVIFDSQIAEVFKRAGHYYDEEINQALGQYVIVSDDMGIYELSKEEILENEDPSMLGMRSLDTCLFNAALCIREFLFNNRCSEDTVVDDLSAGVAVYRKNNQPEADFWRNVCRELIDFEKGKLF